MRGGCLGLVLSISGSVEGVLMVCRRRRVGDVHRGGRIGLNRCVAVYVDRGDFFGDGGQSGVVDFSSVVIIMVGDEDTRTVQ